MRQPPGLLVLSVLIDADQATPDAIDRSTRSVSSQNGVDCEVVVLPEGGERGARVADAIGSARGEIVLVLRAGEILSSATVAQELARELETGADLVVGWDAVESGGGVTAITVPPAWSPQRLLRQDWVGRTYAVRRTLAQAACVTPLVEPAWSHALLLRIADSAREIVAFEEALVSGPQRAPASREATAAAVMAHLDERGVTASVVPGAVEGTCVVTHLAPPELGVAVVVPTDGSRGLVRGERRAFVVGAVRAVLAQAWSTRLEVIVVHTGDTPRWVREELLALGEQVRLVEHEAPFSHARFANIGAITTRAEVVVVLDQYTEARSSDFLDTLVAPLGDPAVGMTGPRTELLDGRVVNGGVALHADRIRDAFALLPQGDQGPGALLTVTREVSALGPHCLAVRRAALEEVGGLTETMPSLYAVDLAMKLRRAGWSRVWVADTVLVALTPPQRKLGPQSSERAAFSTRWLPGEADEFLPELGARTAERVRRMDDEPVAQA